MKEKTLSLYRIGVSWMMYKIKYSYRTGDSFHTEDREEILEEFEWKDMEIAKEALKRIEEHYRWYASLEHYGRYGESEVKKPEWHNVDAKDDYTGKSLLNIRMDNGKEIQFWPPWCGYFETLYGAEIVLDESFTI